MTPAEASLIIAILALTLTISAAVARYVAGIAGQQIRKDTIDAQDKSLDAYEKRMDVMEAGATERTEKIEQQAAQIAELTTRVKQLEKQRQADENTIAKLRRRVEQLTAVILVLGGVVPPEEP